MNIYKLNFLKWITNNEVPEDMLKTAHNFKQKGDKFSFKCSANISKNDWRACYGSTK